MTISKSRRFRRLATFSIVVVALASANGCAALPFDPPNSGAVSIQASETGLRITVCKSITATRIWLQSRNVAEGRAWSQLWDATGQSHLERLTMISTSGTEGFGAATTQPSLASGEELSLMIVGTESESIDAEFGPLPESGLSKDQWLQSDGSSSSEPCPSPKSAK
ncbi:hypothetical protein [Subtercola frigoramans]|uniref:Secreted protein n=1 Tax=Subtercola frigoramans TaxID=120298 RepID=A0ABS2L2C7_9MICO|nr:hypothetical protein [Subtercola frigoramans]MBM7470915.1 hypothetical protein [Subtercola frigoramans]